MRKILILTFFACYALAQTIALNNADVVELKISKGELILLNLPFKVASEKDIELFGSKKHVDVRFKNKSIYFATSILPLKMLVYGGDTPLYFEFKEGKADQVSRVFSFVDTVGINQDEKKYVLADVDKKIVDIVKTISDDGEFTQKNYYKEDMNSSLIVEGVEVYHKARYKDPQLIIDKYFVYNPTLENKKLRDIKLFTKEQKVLANAFGNFNAILGYDNSTWVYVFREPVEGTRDE